MFPARPPAPPLDCLRLAEVRITAHIGRGGDPSGPAAQTFPHPRRLPEDLSPGRGPGSAGSISRGCPAHFRPWPTPAPPTAGIRAPRGMAGSPRSPRPSWSPRPLVAPPPGPFQPGGVQPVWTRPATSRPDPAGPRLCPRLTASRRELASRPSKARPAVSLV